MSSCEHHHDPEDHFYAMAASIAVERTRSPGKDEHMAFIGFDKEKGTEKWAAIASGLMSAVVDKYAEEMLLQGEPISDEEKRTLSFAIGFYFGRAFEEIQVLELSKTGDLSV